MDGRSITHSRNVKKGCETYMIYHPPFSLGGRIRSYSTTGHRGSQQLTAISWEWDTGPLLQMTFSNPIASLADDLQPRLPYLKICA